MLLVKWASMRRRAPSGVAPVLDAPQGHAGRIHPECIMAKRFPILPAHPERTCWGCDRYCAADAMICGNGTERTQHPVEMFGPGWEKKGLDPLQPDAPADAVA